MPGYPGTTKYESPGEANPLPGEFHVNIKVLKIKAKAVTAHSYFLTNLKIILYGLYPHFLFLQGGNSHGHRFGPRGGGGIGNVII